jgi:hypothetical protein
MAKSPVRQRIRAMLAWGVDLHDESGQVHECWPARTCSCRSRTSQPWTRSSPLSRTAGEFDGNLLVIKRTLIDPAGRRLEEIPAEKVTPPTEGEVAAVNEALDFLGYTGQREIRLLLALDHT